MRLLDTAAADTIGTAFCIASWRARGEDLGPLCISSESDRRAYQH